MRLLCVGDSLVNGFPYPRSSSFPSVVAQKTGFDVVNMGMNGITADDTERVLDRALGSADAMPGSDMPDAVLISCGSNDFMMGCAGPKDILRLVVRMASRAHKAGVSEVYVCAPPLTDPEKASRLWMPGVDYGKVNDMLAEYKSLIEEYSQGGGEALSSFRFIDIQSGYSGFGKYADGVHPTEEGYRLIGDIVASSLR